MNIELVPMVEGDRAFFRKVHHIAYRAVVEAMFGWDEKYQDSCADIDFNERNPHIIKHEGGAVGAIGWQEKENHIWFGPLFILPEYQNKKIGSFLIKQFIDKACAQGLSLRLQTLRQNLKAKKLYEKFGFSVLSSSDIYWQMEYTHKGVVNHA